MTMGEASMKISFEWKTKSLDYAKKAELESEINRQLTENFESYMSREAMALAVSLHESETPDALVKGEICRVVHGIGLAQKELICCIKIDRGYLIQCDDIAFFQPRKSQ